ncbi:MAG: nuclear transport factor 2 family protein [Chitinophagales bacterium]
MLIRVILLFLSLAFTLPLCSQNGRVLDSVRFSKMVDRDTNFLKEKIDPNLFYIHSNGLIETKTDHIQNIIDQTIRYQKFEILEANYARYEDHLLGRGLVKVLGVYKGTEFTVFLRFSNEYKKTNGKWRLLYWQSTKVTQ